jgi:hypothetical protein
VQDTVDEGIIYNFVSTRAKLRNRTPASEQNSDFENKLQENFEEFIALVSQAVPVSPLSCPYTASTLTMILARRPRTKSPNVRRKLNSNDIPPITTSPQTFQSSTTSLENRRLARIRSRYRPQEPFGSLTRQYNPEGEQEFPMKPLGSRMARCDRGGRGYQGGFRGVSQPPLHPEKKSSKKWISVSSSENPVVYLVGHLV